MPINTTTILKEDASKLLNLSEGHYVELKGVDIKPARLTESVSALANADGGDLWVGISENQTRTIRQWHGFLNAESANSHLQVLDQLFPLGNDFTYTFLNCADMSGLVLHLEIKKTSDIKCASNGTAYLRRGAQNLPQTSADSINRLRYNKGLTSFETERVNVEPESISNSEHILMFMLDVVPNTEPMTWLQKQRLLVDAKPTVAGILLFAEEPQAILPKRCAIKIYRYKTKDAVGSRETLAFDPLTIEGAAYVQVHQALARTVEAVEAIAKLGVESFEQITYPREALHEIITNAVLHRDYSLADDIHVRVFDNRIEVESPGRLPAHVTTKNILNERFARNGNLVRIINKFPNPPNKDVGEGLNTAFDAMRKLRLKEPLIYERENSVVVNLRHEPLASPEEIIMEYLSNNGQINNKTAREICHVSADWVIRGIFKKLEEKGYIEPVPDKKTSASAYRKRGTL